MYFSYSFATSTKKFINKNAAKALKTISEIEFKRSGKNVA